MAGSHEVRGSNPLGSTFNGLFELGKRRKGSNISANSASEGAIVDGDDPGLEAQSWSCQVERAAALEYPKAMNRGTGTGLIAFGVVLGVVGAVMAFAVTVRTRGFNINTAGWILLIVGIVVLVIGIAILVTGSRRSSTTVQNVQNTPTGQERVEERRDWGTS